MLPQPQALPRRDLALGFDQQFEIVPATDPVSLAQVFAIRHEVYCRDLGWEAVRQDGQETDEYDFQSLHCLLRRRVDGSPVGCLRLILTDPDHPQRPLPFEEHCAGVLDRKLADPARLPRHTVGEASRLAVLKSFRKRRGEEDRPASLRARDFGPRHDERESDDATGAPGMDDGASRFPFIPVSLFLAAAAMAVRFGVDHVFVLTEPRLAAHFARIGFDIRVVGAPIEFRGQRVPSLMRSRVVVAGLRPLIRPLYELIEERIDRAFRPFATTHEVIAATQPAPLS